MMKKKADLKGNIVEEGNELACLQAVTALCPMAVLFTKAALLAEMLAGMKH